MLERLRHQLDATDDPQLIKLYEELKTYPIPARAARERRPADSVAIPFQVKFNDTVLSFISTTMVFGTPVDITLSELALETFFPADDATATALRAIAAQLKPATL